MGIVGIISIGKECKNWKEIHDFLKMINPLYDRESAESIVPFEKIKIKNEFSREKDFYFSVNTYGDSIDHLIETQKRVWVGCNLRNSWDSEDDYAELDFIKLQKIVQQFKKMYNYEFRCILDVKQY